MQALSGPLKGVGLQKLAGMAEGCVVTGHQQAIFSGVSETERPLAFGGWDHS